jgi:alanyl-tRNA synthetase
MEFEAKVLRIFGRSVVLDKTSFYARGGGQEPDHGTISNYKVIDVNKHGGIVVHELEGGIPKEGDVVKCKVDSLRRENITKNHTSTHILNSSSRSVLGSWIWQHSAFKEADHARLDITHHSPLSENEIKEIEKVANSVVKQNIPVSIDNFDRGDAEQKYGFKIYQGGVVPVKSVRIVSIKDFDVEACGGTHVKKTGDIEIIKITKTKRIQDGVVRIEFVSGQTAFDYIKQKEFDEAKNLEESVQKEQMQNQREERKQKAREKIPILLEKISTYHNEDATIIDEIQIHMKNSIKFCFTSSDQYDEFFHINFGKKLVKDNPVITYLGIFETGSKIRIIVYSGEEASKSKNAGNIAKSMAEILGGAGGGDAKFAQGGGKDTSKKDEAINKAKSIVLG